MNMNGSARGNVRVRCCVATGESGRKPGSSPWCIRCKEKGRLVPATVVDHIKPHRGDPDLFWDEKNWQPLCKSCHDHKTMTKDRNVEYKY